MFLETVVIPSSALRRRFALPSRRAQITREGNANVFGNGLLILGSLVCTHFCRTNAAAAQSWESRSGPPVAAGTARPGLDPVSWTSSERWIRCPEWDQSKAADEPGDSSLRSSRKGPSGSCWTKARRVGAVARELDLTASALGLWVEQARAERTKGKSGLMKEEREELTRLRKENRDAARGARHPKKRVSGPGAARLVDQKLRGVRSLARGRGRSLSGDIVSPLKNMVRGWPAHMSVVTPQGDPV